jgi:3-oxoacyl-[acyl-carrier protein] reductase
MVLAGGWIVVAGAGGALGVGVVEHYARQGMNVLALDLKVDHIARPDNVIALATDLASPEAVDGALDHIPRSAAIRLLVNSVGLIWNEPVLAMQGARMSTHSIDAFVNVITANLTAAFVIASRVAARMARRGGGSIINFSSVSAEGIAGQAAYGAAKAGIIGMTRAMASELGPLAIRVNAIAPGFIDVPSTRAALSEQKLAEYVGRTPIGRLGSLAELIEAIDFLASNSLINGAVIAADGGLRM